MSQKYSVQVTEGEMDEDEEEINQQVTETLPNKQAPPLQQEEQISILHEYHLCNLSL